MADPHDCPGCGGPGVPHHRLACNACWWRLPKDLRDAVTANYKAMRYAQSPNIRSKATVAHRHALVSATSWWRNNPAAA